VSYEIEISILNFAVELEHKPAIQFVDGESGAVRAKIRMRKLGQPIIAVPKHPFFLVEVMRVEM